MGVTSGRRQSQLEAGHIVTERAEHKAQKTWSATRKTGTTLNEIVIRQDLPLSVLCEYTQKYSESTPLNRRVRKFEINERPVPTSSRVDMK